MLPENNCDWRDWHIPLSQGDYTLREALDSVHQIGAGANEVPLVVRLVENPDFRMPGITIFNGSVNLHDHDCIHAILGRGLLAKDEAFTIGFTMGSTNRVTSIESGLYSFAAKYLYPPPYKFSEDDIEVFKKAVRLGAVSECLALDSVNYKEYYNFSLQEIRSQLGIEEDLLKACYRIEKKRFIHSLESQRLLL